MSARSDWCTCVLWFVNTLCAYMCNTCFVRELNQTELRHLCVQFHIVSISDWLSGWFCIM